MSTTVDEAPTRQKSKKSRAISTYHVLVLERDQGGTIWRNLGTVEAVNPDTARISALSAAGIETATCVAVPARSWKPELFTTQQAAVKYVKGASAHV